MGQKGRNLIACIGVVYGCCLAGVDMPRAEAFLDVKTVTIPDELGSVGETAQGSGDYVMFVVSDIHNNYDAQRSVAGIVDFLVQQYDAAVIGVEGAAGPIDVAPLGTYYQKTVRENVAAYYLRQGFIDGPVFHALVTGDTVPLVGVEDVKRYQAAQTWYTTTMSQRTEALEQISLLQGMLDSFKTKLLSEDMQELEQAVTNYAHETLPLKDYTVLLIRLADKMNVSLTPYAQLVMVRDATMIENTVDFTLIPAEEERCLELLTGVLGTDLAARRVLQDVRERYAAKTVSPDDYYATLYRLMQQYKVPFADVPHMERVMKAASLMRKTDTLRLHDEATAMVATLRTALRTAVNDPVVKEFLALVQSLALLERVVSLAASQDEVTMVLDAPEQFMSPRFIQFIRDHALKCNVSFRIHPRVVAIDKVVPLLKEYYSAAHERSTTLAQGLVGACQARQKVRGVLVTGTFHVRDVLRYYTAQKYSVVVLNPAVRQLTNTIPLDRFFTARDIPVATYLKTAAVHVRPWSLLCPYNGDNLPGAIRTLLAAECEIEDLYERLITKRAGQDPLSVRVVTRELYALKKATISFMERPLITPRSIIALTDTENYFFQVTIAGTTGRVELLMEPIAQREGPYGTSMIERMPALKEAQLERGIYRSSERLVSVLKGEQGTVYGFDASLVGGVEQELAEMKKAEEAAALQPPAVSTPAPAIRATATVYDEHDRASVAEKMDSVNDVQQAIQRAVTIDELNELKNRFLLLKSQLSFYVLIQKDYQYINAVEQELNARIAQVVSLMDEQERKKKAAAEEARQRELYERDQQIARARSEQRKTIDTVIKAIGDLQVAISAADSFTKLSAVEDRFNALIETVSADVLTTNDRTVLTAFKVAWETKYREMSEQRSPAQGAAGTETATATAEILRKAVELKKLVELASLPADAIFVQDEFKKLRKLSGFSLLSSDERAIIDKTGMYIDQVLADLKAGTVDGGKITVTSTLRPSVPATVSPAGANTPPVESDTGSMIAAVYALRSSVMQTTSLEGLTAVKKQFDQIDQQLREHTLDRSQKTLLADTERMIRDAMQRLIIQAEKAVSAREQVAREEQQRVRQQLLKDLLGTTGDKTVEAKRIAYIEDNTYESNAIRPRLEEEGYVVDCYSSYNVPFEVLAPSRVQAVLLDDDIIGTTTGLDFMVKMSEAKKSGIAFPPVLLHTNSSLNWIRDALKRKGIVAGGDMYLTSKRDIESTITILNKMTAHNKT